MAQSPLPEPETASNAEKGVKSGANVLRGNNFNFIRFALAALVIFAHSYPLIDPAARNEPLQRFTRQQLFSGDLAVDGFFIISGFLILQSWLYSRSAGDYLRKRALRIYPGYLACALLCIFVIGPIGMGSASAYFHTMPWKHNLIGLPFLASLPLEPFRRQPYALVNGSLWTISAEFFLAVQNSLTG